MTAEHALDDRPLVPVHRTANKVPEVTVCFWLIKVLTTGMGETASDLLARLLGPIPAVALGGLALVASLAVQFFYWAAVLATFALGTAAGDLTATVGFGYLGSVVLFAAAICVPALAHRFSALNAVTAFWTAYVITRPLGASLADWMALGHTRGGLGLGLTPVTLAWTAAIMGFVGYLTASQRDTGAHSAA